MIAKSGIDGTNLDGFFELNNGCICCSSKGDLILTLEKLLLHKDRFDYILIETTGLANPGPVIASLWCDDANTSLKLDGIVTLVDSVNINSYVSRADICNDVCLLYSKSPMPSSYSVVRYTNGLTEYSMLMGADVPKTSRFRFLSTSPDDAVLVTIALRQSMRFDVLVNRRISFHSH